ncbi:MAG: protein arginine kinase [Lentisphaerae bacterium GWF2_45_14]|nr:MAG: protein arginine kinase [Lentisphaerae bacterium GWF2_45_14]
MRNDKSGIDRLLSNRVSWLADSGPEDDIAISSRIRLARNIEKTPFPMAASVEILENTLSIIMHAVRKSASFPDVIEFELEKVSDLERRLLLERRLISRELLACKKGSGLSVSKDETFAVMINEEDHLRIQAMKPGFQLHEVWSDINGIDDALSREIPYAFDSEIGFLTSCPTNIGTGMRASVMLHLPGLALSGQINAVVHGVSKLGLAVRGIFGEGSDNLGNLFQVSNQSTLGESEEQIIDKLINVIRQIINHEKNARQTLLEKKQNFLLNHVGRAYGILKHAYTISSEETLNSLSALRLGVDMGMFSSVDIHVVNELFLTVQPAHLQKYAMRELESADREIYRAALVREKLRNIDSRN